MIYPDRLFRAIPVNNETGAYIEIWFNSPFVRQRIIDIAKSSAGHQRITQADINVQPIAVPPMSQQIVITDEVKRRLSVIENALEIIHLNLRRTERLRQSILKDAFAGRLVPQDPDDEPANILLARIRAEREQRP